MPEILLALEGKVDFVEATTPGAADKPEDEAKLQGKLLAANFKDFARLHNQQWQKKSGRKN